MKTKKVVFVQVIWIASLSRHEIIPVYGFTNVEFIDRFFGLFFLLMKLFLHRIFFKVLSTSKKVWIDWIFISISAVYSLKMSISALRIFGLKKEKKFSNYFQRFTNPKIGAEPAKMIATLSTLHIMTTPLLKRNVKIYYPRRKKHTLKIGVRQFGFPHKRV